MFKINYCFKHRFLYLLGLLFSFSCNLFAQTYDGFQTINHNQTDRHFYLYVPNNYSVNNPIPILFNFHGGGGDPVTYMNYTSDMRGLAEENNFILIYPKQLLTQVPEVFHGSIKLQTVPQGMKRILLMQ